MLRNLDEINFDISMVLEEEIDDNYEPTLGGSFNISVMTSRNKRIRRIHWNECIN